MTEHDSGGYLVKGRRRGGGRVGWVAGPAWRKVG
jgi:hypothetical protein